LLLLCLLVCPHAARAEDADAGRQAAATAHADQHVLEVTFGSAQLFNRQSVVTKSGRVEEQVIPVSSALLMVEWLFHRRLSLLSLFNLPLDTQKTVIDDQVREEFVAPSLSLGVRVSALSVEVFAASRLELQLAALAGVTIGSSSGDAVFPLAATRLHFANQQGFALYIGGAFAFRRDTVALLYGIGHRF
jgi:hypothetical protein